MIRNDILLYYSSRITIRETSSATSWKQMHRPIAKH